MPISWSSSVDGGRLHGTGCGWRLRASEAGWEGKRREEQDDLNGNGPREEGRLHQTAGTIRVDERNGK